MYSATADWYADSALFLKIFTIFQHPHTPESATTSRINHMRAHFGLRRQDLYAKLPIKQPYIDQTSHINLLKTRHEQEAGIVYSPSTRAKTRGTQQHFCILSCGWDIKSVGVSRGFACLALYRAYLSTFPKNLLNAYMYYNNRVV